MYACTTDNFAKELKLVGIIHAYALVIRSDPSTNSKLGFGCSVSHSGKGRQGADVPGGARRRRRAPRRPGHLAWGSSAGRRVVAKREERAHAGGWKNRRKQGREGCSREVHRGNGLTPEDSADLSDLKILG